MSAKSRRECVLGVDFGTSYSTAATVVDGRIKFVVDNGDPMIPSAVHIPPRGEPIIGAGAITRLISSPERTITSVKRLLGRRADEKEVKAVDVNVGYKIKSGPRGLAVIEVDRQEYACEQIASMILGRLRELAEKRFGMRIRQAVLGVPAATPPAYVDALRRAARLAHLELLQVVPEPIAGALAAGVHMENRNQRLAICDYGGGTFDATLIEQRGQLFSPIACSGDPFLGGDDFDDAMASAISAHVYRKSSFEMKNDLVRWRELIVRCESTKRRLSTRPEARLTMNEAYIVRGERCTLDVSVDREWIEPHWASYVQRAVGVVASLLTKSNWSASHVDKVVLIGGSSLMPIVYRAFSELFPGSSVVRSEWANVAVATGVALQTQAHAPISTDAPVLAS